jgi:hypothetical protein
MTDLLCQLSLRELEEVSLRLDGNNGVTDRSNKMIITTVTILCRVLRRYSLCESVSPAYLTPGLLRDLKKGSWGLEKRDVNQFHAPELTIHDDILLPKQMKLFRPLVLLQWTRFT